MNTFLTADPHFGHEGARKHCNRPWNTVADMDDGLTENWNNIVGRKDRVYIVGDFAWKNHAKYLNKLRGKKILITGNHDKMPKASLEQFTQVVGCNKQPGTLEMVMNGKLIVMGHYRHMTWRNSCHGSWHFYGHSHGRMFESDNQLSCDVGVDIWDYMPVPWEVLEAKMTARTEAWLESNKEAPGGTSWLEYDDYVDPLRVCNRKFRDQFHVTSGGVVRW